MVVGICSSKGYRKIRTGSSVISCGGMRTVKILLVESRDLKHLFDLLYLQETGAVAIPTSVVQAIAPSMKEGEDRELEPYQEEMENIKVCHVQRQSVRSI